MTRWIIKIMGAQLEFKRFPSYERNFHRPFVIFLCSNERQNFTKGIIVDERIVDEEVYKKKKKGKGRDDIQITNPDRKEESKGKFLEGERLILFPSLSPPTSHFHRSRN